MFRIFVLKQTQKSMPTCFIVEGMRFFFYSNEHDPIHVHVSKAEAQAKFTVVPETILIESYDLSSKDLKRAEEIINNRKEEIIKKWLAHFVK